MGSAHQLYELFQSTPSVGRTTIYAPFCYRFWAFQSTPSVGRTTLVVGIIYGFIKISIHALRGEDDSFAIRTKLVNLTISIHALRGEDDNYTQEDIKSLAISIHALRGEDDTFLACKAWHGVISIHALRGEDDKHRNTVFQRILHFNPRPPWGGRPFCPRTMCGRSRYFNPRPPWGGRRLLRLLTLYTPLFQSTPSVGRTT